MSASPERIPPGVWYCELCRVMMLHSEAAKGECVHRPAGLACPLALRREPAIETAA